jgi:hypothetical protein
VCALPSLACSHGVCLLPLLVGAAIITVRRNSECINRRNTAATQTRAGTRLAHPTPTEELAPSGGCDEFVTPECDRDGERCKSEHDQFCIYSTSFAS